VTGKPNHSIPDFLKEKVRQVKFISAPLAGLTSHLLTRCEGAHVKPNVRVQGKQVRPMTDAVSVGSGFDPETIQVIDGESALTPYGSLMEFGKQQYPNAPFKGVTHGQMQLTKINIVDKFGQAICVPAPAPTLRNQTHPPDSKIYPSLSEYLAPDIVDGALNTVFKSDHTVPGPDREGEWPLCEYIQLSPSINQEARINASYLIRDTLQAPWRDATEYENPVVGWIIINYADSALQLFYPDGRFYREIRKGGPSSQDVSPKYIPFDAGTINVTTPQTAQLDELISKLSPDPQNPTDRNYVQYLQAWFDMINGSIQNMPFPPSDYSGYANAIVGKPLAIVNAGWSVEMAAPAIKAQNTRGKLPTDDGSNEQQILENYSFPLKIGDIERSYDGLVGYFLVKDSPSATASTSTPDLSKMYTYFAPTPTSNVVDISSDTSQLPKLHPYYLDPDPLMQIDLTGAHAAHYTVTTLVIDPYTPIHAFSPILPTKSLKLPPWTIKQAFQKMHAFFHLGPSLLTHDVPRSPTEARDMIADPNYAVKLPVSGRKGLWQWLQPYPRPRSSGNSQVTPQKSSKQSTGRDAHQSQVSGLEPTYIPINVQEDLGQTKFEAAPYTFIEGYLQLMGNLGNTADPTSSRAPTSAT
jgi:hypothetical protein